MLTREERAHEVAKLMREMRECDLQEHKIYRACSGVLRRAVYGSSHFVDSGVAKEIVDKLPRVHH